MRATLSAADGKRWKPRIFGGRSPEQDQAHRTPVSTLLSGLLTSYVPSLVVLLITLSAAGFAWWTARRSTDLVDDSGWVLLVGLAFAASVTLLVVHSDRDRAELARQAASAAERIEAVEAKSRVERDGFEAALRDSTESHRLAVQASEGGFWDWDLRKNEIRFSARWEGLLGFAEDELGHRPLEWFRRVHPEDCTRLRADLLNHLRGQTSVFEFEHRMRHRDGSYRWMLSRGIAVRDDKGRPKRLVGSHTDVTRYREAEKRLVQAAMHDPLTGLPNRTYFMERLAVSGRHAHKHPDCLFALLFLDVDRFKVVNDSLGHLVGDELLVSIGERLKTCVRPNDTIARLGGDEFAILLDDLHEELEATQIAEAIQRELARPFHVADREIFAAVSIGVTFNSAAHQRAEDILRDADAAISRAKEHGKAGYATFDQEMKTRAVERLNLERDLRRGLDRSEFLIYYQPIYDLASARITGCEALLRWQHPERGLVLPNDFIPVAEETGLIIPVSEWLLHTACEQTKAWEKDGLPSLQLSVNVSPRQFNRHDVFEVVNRTLEQSGLDPSLLLLELTESALVENADTTITPIVELYARGVEIALDDFGTGYSSLIYLRRFPISVLKISESFTRQIATNPGDAAIATGLLALAHSLDLRVVAEGVETEEQMDFLRLKKCDAVQGHIISPPVAAADFTTLLKQQGLSVTV